VFVVDRLEAVEVGHDDADGAAVDHGLGGDLGQAPAQRAAVEHAGQRVDDRLAAVLDVGAHQRGRQDRHAAQQREREEHVLGCVGGRGGLEAHGGQEHQARGQRDAGSHPA
jgi:hypothetical protein